MPRDGARALQTATIRRSRVGDAAIARRGNGTGASGR